MSDNCHFWNFSCSTTETAADDQSKRTAPCYESPFITKKNRVGIIYLQCTFRRYPAAVILTSQQSVTLE